MDETNAYYAEQVLGNKYTLEKLLEAEPTLKDKILSFFKGASTDYADVPKLSSAAKRYYKTYKKLFDEFSARNVESNSMENAHLSTLFAENLQKTPLTNMKQENMQDNGRDYALEETEDGRLIAVVEDDILSGIYTGHWNKATADKAKKAAKTALLKFKDGIAVKGITAKVNKTSRDEYARSNYSEALRKHDPETYADKLRAASVADDVVIAASNWNRDGGLKYPRKDDFVDFDRGETLIMSGNNQYKADVIIGITSKGEYVFYDIENMYPTQFDVKKQGILPAVTPDEPFDAILKDSSNSSISQNTKKSNSFDKKTSDRQDARQYAVSLDEDNNGRKLTSEQSKYFKNSTVRDAEGRLLTLYHGTDAEFTTFEKGHKRTRGRLNLGEGFYFATTRSYAGNYSNGRIVEAYVNLTNPYRVIGNQFTEWEMDDIRSKLSAEDRSKLNYDNVSDYLVKLGYDGVLGLNYSGTKTTINSVVAFKSNQIKNVSNQTPTVNPDINYALDIDSDDGNISGAEAMSWLNDKPESDGKLDLEATVARGLPYKRGKSDLTVGELRKVIANTTHEKVYSKSDALKAVNKLSGTWGLTVKARDEIADTVWQFLNEAPDIEYRQDMAHDIAEYIVAKVLMDSKTENPDALEAAERLSYLRTGIGKLSFTDADIAELRHAVDEKGLKRIMGENLLNHIGERMFPFPFDNRRDR